MEFKEFKIKFQENFKKLVEGQDTLFVTNIEKDIIWETYLNSFPEDIRQEFNCNCCKQFLRPFANVVVVKNGVTTSIWDFECAAPYKEVVKNLSKLVLSAPIRDVYVTKFAKIGTNFNHEEVKDELGKTKEVITWDHFYLELPKNFVDKSSYSEESIMGQYRDAKNVFKRALEEITIDSVETALELIEQNSLYRGEESKGVLTVLLGFKNLYKKLPENQKDNFAWINSIKNPGIAKIRNTAIGTLLIDISEGKDLDHAVSAFEKIMAPINYKRPTTIITKKMIEDAQKTIEELGFADSLARRHASVDDITINNVLFANRDAKKIMNVFDELAKETAVNSKKFDKIEEVSIDTFIENILPKATSIELLLESKHQNNLMSLVAPVNKTAPSMLKWNNNFSWGYNNDVTDSIKERVKTQGGKVDGELRFSIMWAEGDKADNSDLDAHCIEPKGNRIYFSSKTNTSTSGALDVDITQPTSYGHKNIVENITWSVKSKMQKGIYKFLVHGFAIRGEQKGFTAEIEFDNQVFYFNYNKPVKNGEYVEVAHVEFDGTNFKVIEKLPANSSTISKEVWNVNTNQFQKVSLMMYSPNYWDGQGVGNKHFFFMLEGCKNPNKPRGFYNEFLKEELMKQKRVFEALGGKMKVEDSDIQLSGLGFNSTTRNSVICKVEGSFTRTIKINF